MFIHSTYHFALRDISDNVAGCKLSGRRREEHGEHAIYSHTYVPLVLTSRELKPRHRDTRGMITVCIYHGVLHSRQQIKTRAHITVWDDVFMCLSGRRGHEDDGDFERTNSISRSSADFRSFACSSVLVRIRYVACAPSSWPMKETTFLSALAFMPEYMRKF